MLVDKKCLTRMAFAEIKSENIDKNKEYNACKQATKITEKLEAMKKNPKNRPGAMPIPKA